MKLTREEALNRVAQWFRTGDSREAGDLLLEVQAETERLVVEKCCEIAEITASECESSKGATACACISNRIREAFPEVHPQ